MSPTPRRYWLPIILLGLAGAILLVILLIQYPIAEVAAGIARARWALIGIMALHMAQLIPETLSWHVLLPRGQRPWSLYWIGWIGESVSTLLPVTQAGGDIVRARLAAQRGVAAAVAAASVVVDVTVSVFVLVACAVLGVVLLIALTGRQTLTAPALAGTTLLLLGVLGFYVVQRYGMFGIVSKGASLLVRDETRRQLVQESDAFDAQVRTLYNNRRSILANAAWNFVCWIVTTGEVWLALRALNIRAGFLEAFLLESVSRVVRAGMFFVPGALGVQEGGYIVVGRLLGIEPEAALALALIRRVREITVGAPALLVWQWIEGRRLFRRRAGAALSSSAP